MDLIIEKINEAFVRVHCEPAIAQELSDAFSFQVDGFMFMPAYKYGRWDGKCRLFNLRTRQMYMGLVPKIIEWAFNHGYSCSIDFDQTIVPASDAQIRAWSANLNLPGIVPHDHQIAAVRAILGAFPQNRGIILSATGTGKSLCAYLLYRYYNQPSLIVVPSIGLVNQLSNDFRDYGYQAPINQMFDGKASNPKAQLTIGTWQGLFRKPKSWFEQFKVVIIDECHLAKAASLISIMEKLEKCPIRIGMSGTLDDSKSNLLTLEGLFGPIVTVAKTSDMIEKKVLADLRIECLVIQYPDKERKTARKYIDEVEYLISHPKRNELIRKLVDKLKGNSLILFQYVEKHGKELYEMIKQTTKRPVYYISGEVKSDERERIRKEIDKQNDAILIASVGTSSVGLNIVSLRNIVFTTPTKSKIRTLQSIGRVLRRSQTKQTAILWDLADNLSWKSRKNHTLKHFINRLEIYNREKFNYKIRNINLKG